MNIDMSGAIRPEVLIAFAVTAIEDCQATQARGPRSIELDILAVCRNQAELGFGDPRDLCAALPTTLAGLQTAAREGSAAPDRLVTPIELRALLAPPPPDPVAAWLIVQHLHEGHSDHLPERFPYSLEQLEVAARKPNRKLASSHRRAANTQALNGSVGLVDADHYLLRYCFWLDRSLVIWARDAAALALVASTGRSPIAIIKVLESHVVIGPDELSIRFARATCDPRPGMSEVRFTAAGQMPCAVQASHLWDLVRPRSLAGSFFTSVHVEGGSNSLTDAKVLRQAVRAMATRADLGNGITLRGLRPSFVRQARKAGLNDFEIAEVMGLVNPATVARYDPAGAAQAVSNGLASLAAEPNTRAR